MVNAVVLQGANGTNGLPLRVGMASQVESITSKFHIEFFSDELVIGIHCIALMRETNHRFINYRIGSESDRILHKLCSQITFRTRPILSTHDGMVLTIR